MSETPDRMPVERLLASAVEFIHARWHRTLARIKEYSFRENPLIARETGWGEGRSLWRSPLLWCLVATLIPFAIQINDHMRYWRVMGELPKDATSDELNAAYRVLWPYWYQWARYLLWWVIYLAPTYFAARTWRRDRFVGRREQIYLAGILPGQLISARVLIWLLVPLLISLLRGLTMYGWNLFSALFSKPGTHQEYMSMLASYELQGLGIPFNVIERFAFGALTILISVRIVLLGGSTLMALIMAALIGHVLDDLFWYIHRALVEAGLIPRRFPYRDVFSLVPVAVAALAWWGLPRRVRRAYGPEGFERGR